MARIASLGIGKHVGFFRKGARYLGIFALFWRAYRLCETMASPFVLTSSAQFRVYDKKSRPIGCRGLGRQSSCDVTKRRSLCRRGRARACLERGKSVKYTQSLSILDHRNRSPATACAPFVAMWSYFQRPRRSISILRRSIDGTRQVNGRQ